MFTSLVLLIGLNTACGSTDSGTGGAGGLGAGGLGAGGTGAGGTGAGGKADGGTGAVDPGGPLLERPSGARYHCSVSRPIARLAVPWGGFSLLPGDPEARLAVTGRDSTNPDPNLPANRLTLSTLSVNGKLGSPAVLRAAPIWLGEVSAAKNGEKSTVVWSESTGDGSTAALKSLQVDDAGMIVTAESVLTAPTGTAVTPKLVSAGSGYALSWIEREGSFSALNFALLDESGKLTGSPVVLAQGTYVVPGDIASVGGHFLLSFGDARYTESGSFGQLLVIGADGHAIGAPIPLQASPGGGISLTLPKLHVRGEQVLAAWSVTSGDNSVEGQEGATTIRIARFDANGERQGLMYDLQAKVTDQESVQPFWVDFGEDLGLLWADGSIIYICGGCVPDHSLKFVVLDGQTFTPQSDVVQLVNTLPAGGLLSPEATRSESDLLVVSSVTYHTSAEGASASIRCGK